MSDRKDPYYYRAKKENYRSRAAFKLIEIQERFFLFSGRENVLELGSSPGGWSQVILENTEGKILSIDRSPQEPLEGVTFIRGDIYTPRIEAEITSFLSHNELKGFDCIVSDTMAKTSGISHRDHALSIELGDRVMHFSDLFLNNGGSVLIKQFQGDMTSDFLKKYGGKFRSSKLATTKATRGGSSEVFLMFRGFIRKLD